MASRRTRTARKQPLTERAQQGAKSALASWLRFTWATDTARVFGVVSHVIVNWVALFALGAAWFFLYASQPMILAGLTLAGLLYTMLRAARHLPARRKTIEGLFVGTQPQFKHPTTQNTNEHDHVKVTKWRTAKAPASGRVRVSGRAPMNDPVARREGEDSIRDAMIPHLKDDHAVLFDHGTKGWMTFDVVPADDLRVQRADVTRDIEDIVIDQFNPKRGQSITVTVQWPQESK